MNVGRTLYWLRFVAELILELVDQTEGDAGSSAPVRAIAVARPGPTMKPERIQFWIGQLARFILEVFEGASGETGKSGEREVEW